MLKKVAGVYYIRNTKNEKVYVGSSHNIDNRWREHRRDLKNNNHDSPHLQNAWHKYGPENFEFKILEEIVIWFDKPTKEQKSALKNNLKFWEQIYLDNYSAANRDRGYNIKPIVENNNMGHKYNSEEHSKKLSEAIKNSEKHKQAVQSEEYRARHRQIMKIAMNNPETKRKQYEAHFGKPRKANKTPSWNKGLTAKTDDRVARNEHKVKESRKANKVPPWDAGLTKETDERIARISEYNKQHKIDPWNKGLTKETSERVANMEMKAQEVLKLRRAEKIIKEENNGVE